MSSKRNPTRRDFLAAAAMTPYFFSQAGRLFGEEPPKKRLRCGCIGVGNRGYGDARDIARMTDVVAISDVDSGYGPVVGAMKNPVFGVGPEGKKTPPDFYSDYRRILDRSDIDVVTVGTPDHWHTKITIEALMAGKHVFCEKPLTLTLEENLLVRAAAEKYHRVVQVGTQQRSMRDQFMAATLLVQKGFLGRIKRVCCTVGVGPVCDAMAKTAVPEKLDLDKWLGPTPMIDYVASGEFQNGAYPLSRTHRVFRYWCDYSGGTVTDWGAHHIDCALWALGLQSKGAGPVSVDGRNVEMPVPYKDGMPTVTDRFNTPKNFDFVFRFPKAAEIVGAANPDVISDELELHLMSDSSDGNGILFEGTEGRMHVNRDRIKGKLIEEGAQKTLTDDDFIALNKGKSLHSHMWNFLACIEEGGLPASDVASHVQGMHCCHLAGIAARLGREIRWDPVAEKIVGDDLAASFFGREARKGYELPKV